MNKINQHLNYIFMKDLIKILSSVGIILLAIGEVLKEYNKATSPKSFKKQIKRPKKKRVIPEVITIV